MSPARNVVVSTRSEWPQTRQKDHPAPSLVETSRLDGVKAPLHLKTPRYAPAMSQSISSSTRYGEALNGKIKADLLMSTTLSFSRGYLSASLSMSFALMARKRSAFSTATSGAISFALYSPSVVTAMGSIVNSVSALEKTLKEGRALGVNWSALTDANRPSTRMALGMVRRRSGIVETRGDVRRFE